MPRPKVLVEIASSVLDMVPSKLAQADVEQLELLCGKLRCASSGLKMKFLSHEEIDRVLSPTCKTLTLDTATGIQQAFQRVVQDTTAEVESLRNFLSCIGDILTICQSKADAAEEGGNPRTENGVKGSSSVLRHKSATCGSKAAASGNDMLSSIANDTEVPKKTSHSTSRRKRWHLSEQRAPICASQPRVNDVDNMDASALGVQLPRVLRPSMQDQTSDMLRERAHSYRLAIQMTTNSIRRRLREKGIDDGGTRDQIIHRLLEATTTHLHDSSELSAARDINTNVPDHPMSLSVTTSQAPHIPKCQELDKSVPSSKSKVVNKSVSLAEIVNSSTLSKLDKPQRKRYRISHT